MKPKDEMQAIKLELKLAIVRASRFYSSDGCWCTAVRCNKCERVYYEELNYAEELVINDKPFFCIRCEDGPQSTKSPRTTVKAWAHLLSRKK